jgi:hypothetical protein
MKAANEVQDFKTFGEQGIYAGKIKSIIPRPSPRAWVAKPFASSTN